MHLHLLFATMSTLVTFVLLLLLVRWIGSTQLTQLTYFNWVAGASMGNLAANMMSTTNTGTLITSGYSLALFTLATIVAAYVALKSRSFRRIANGEPVVLIHKGALLRENLRRSKVNLDVLLMMLREKGYFAYADIEYAILEPTGNLSILPTAATQSASKKDLVHPPDLSGKGQGPYVEIVVDGHIDQDKLASTGRDEAWVRDVLEKHDVRELADVMYLGVNKEGEVVIDAHRLDKPSDPLK